MISALEINYNKITQSDRCRAWALAVILNTDTIRYIFSTFLKNIIPIVTILNLLIMMICWGPVLYAFFKKPEPLKKYNWELPLLIIILFLITLALNSQSYDSIVLGCGGYYRAQDLVFSPIKGVVCFYLVSRLTSSDAMKYWLNMTVIMAFLLNSWQPILLSKLDVVQTIHSLSTGRDVEVTYTAYLGYGLSLVMLFSVLHSILFTTRRVFFVMLGIISVIEILLWGNRGVFLQLGILLILFLCNVGGISKGKKSIRSLLMLAVVVLAVAIYYYWIEIILAIKGLGIESRSINSIIEGNMFDSNGREDYQIAVVKLINSNIWGGGVYSSLTEYKFYAHNFFLDLFSDFGYIIGGCIVLFFLVKLVQAFKRFAIQNYLFPFVIIFSYTFGKILVSNYYMFENYFWVCLAMVVVGLRKIPRNNIANP